LSTNFGAIAATMHTPEAHAADLAAFTTATLRELRRLVVARHQLDLASVHWHVGRLCAACLDLPLEIGCALRPLLREVAGEMDALTAALIEKGP
jgi:hypothetical protein